MPKEKTITIFLGIIILATPFIVGAQTIGQEVIFNIDPSYDLKGRENLIAILVKTTNQLYFYVDKDWWQKLAQEKRQILDLALYNLASEFEYKIYPNLTKIFGSEPKPGIDKDERITILIHPMNSEVGGYFNSGDLYSKFQNPKSNQREMIYLNSQHIEKPLAKSFLAHEFFHLITANQKEILRNVSEETWLNELRAEYAPTFLGYDDIYKGSNLEKRVKVFLENPNDSLTEWQNKSPDYGVVNLFGQYLLDHYGVEILADSLKSSKIGIPSINEALAKNGFREDFSQIFTDWQIALLVGDCQIGQKYCYLNKNLKNLRIAPTIYYLPKTETILSTYHSTTFWAPSWQRFVGGEGMISFEFDGEDLVEFEVPYLICDLKNNCSVGFLELDGKQKGKVSFPQFDSKYHSFLGLPFIKSKIIGFDGREGSFSFSWQVSVKKESEEELKNQLLAQIEFLKAEIARVQAQINAILAQRGKLISCQKLENNLYYGLMQNSEVRCLQEFLKSQGPEIYPEGLITGNFLSLTRAAVIRFQEKYASEILKPLGLEKGTGFVGSKTREKINQMLRQFF